MEKGQVLIKKLLANPNKEEAEGIAIDLIFEYADGFDIETLRPLLRSDNLVVQRVVASILDNLEDSVCALLDDIIPLSKSEYFQIRSTAVKCIHVCTNGDPADLVERIITNPKQADDDGIADILLQEYFNGFDLETLRPLLRSDDPVVQSAATFIVFELGSNASSLMDDILPLLESHNPSKRLEVLGCVMECSAERTEHLDKFTLVLEAMEDTHQGNRIFSMGLVSNANEEQIEAGIRQFQSRNDSESHVLGLELLLRCFAISESEILKFTNSDDPILRKYGAIATTKMATTFPNRVYSLLLNDDDEIREYAQNHIDIHIN